MEVYENSVLPLQFFCKFVNILTLIVYVNIFNVTKGGGLEIGMGMRKLLGVMITFSVLTDIWVTQAYSFVTPVESFT